MTRRAPRSSDGGRSEAIEALGRTAAVLTGRTLSSESREKFERYLDLLVTWNRAQRLTAFYSPRDIAQRLFADSLLFWELLPPRPLSMVDIGAGAGIPGIPLRILDPGISLTLIESKQKRVSFLRTISRELGLEKEIAVFEGRAEGLRNQVIESKGEFDIAVSRSVGPLEEIAPIALKYLRPQGLFICSGPPPDHPRPNPRLEAIGCEVTYDVRDFPRLGLKRMFIVVRAT